MRGNWIRDEDEIDWAPPVDWRWRDSAQHRSWSEADYGVAGEPYSFDIALEIYERGGPRRLELEARILARQPSEVIAAKLAITPQVVDIFIAHFFDVLGRMSARDWIVVRAIRNQPGDSLADRLAVVLKTWAYFGGVERLELALPFCTDGGVRLYLSSDLSTEAGRLEERIRLAILVDAIEINKKNVTKLLRLHAAIIESEKRRTAGTASHAPLWVKGSEDVSETTTHQPDALVNPVPAEAVVESSSAQNVA